MPIVRRIWSPNTCRCSFVVDLDTDLPDALIDFIFVAVIRNDGLHGPVTDAALLTAAHVDNRLMNDVLGEIQKIQPAVLPSNYRWSFDAARDITVSFELDDSKDGPGVVPDNAEKALLRVAVDGRFGLGKVSVT